MRAAAGPKGLDMVFENVGGEQFEAAFRALGQGGRIAVCGAIAEYNKGKAPTVAIDQSNMIYSAQRIEGFVCTPWLLKGDFLPHMAQALKEGLKVTHSFSEGIESACCAPQPPARLVCPPSARTAHPAAAPLTPQAGPRPLRASLPAPTWARWWCACEHGEQ